MKLKIAFIALLLLAVLVTAVPAMAKPTTFTVSYNQVQFQWRGNKTAFGTWSVIYPTYAGHFDFRRTGNVLHSSITYKPSPIDVQGASNVYVYDDEEAKWILKEGTVEYTSLASGFHITEYFRGYVDFDSAMTFEHGVLYQWAYVYLPQSDEAIVKAKYKYAVWDDVMGAWLAGFSIYLQDPTVIPPPAIPFPSPFIEPVPASNYNPLGL